MTERKLVLFEVVTHKSSYYASSDLDYLQSVLDNILVEMRGQKDPRADAWNLEALRMQLSAALFRCADRGERDFGALKRRALEAIPMVSVRWPSQPANWPDGLVTAEVGRR